MQFKQVAMPLRTVIITFLVMVGCHHAGMAQSQATAPAAKPQVAQLAPDAAVPDWVYKSINVLAQAGVIRPLSILHAPYSRYTLTVIIARLPYSHPQPFMMPPLAQTNAAFYTRDAQGNWLPRYTRADVKAEFLKLRQEFAPELARLGSIDEMPRRNRLSSAERLEQFLADPPLPTPKMVEAHILRAETIAYPFSTRGKTTIDLAADIALPEGCQLTVLPTWSWQIVSVQWRATTHDAWSIKPPAYSATLISPDQAPTALYECGLANAGQWQITAQATVHYQTSTCGSGTAVVTGNLEIPTTLFEPQQSSGGLPQPPSIFIPRTTKTWGAQHRG